MTELRDDAHADRQSARDVVLRVPTYPARLSDAERDKALSVLRDGVAMGRLSHDTSSAGWSWRSPPAAWMSCPRSPPTCAPRAGCRGWFSAPSRRCPVGVRLGRAWRAERLPKLLLPHPGAGHPLRIGRDPASGLRLSHETVSRVHAELSLQGGMWVLRDLGSTNGTTVNGRRVIGAAVVREGDQIGFGGMAFRLAAN
ncbi:FHA domain-containing protein OS=Streptomyces tendae OX=1932 GN=GUR47_31580 PE=4 SV=1 [Streptomyces tendae]